MISMSPLGSAAVFAAPNKARGNTLQANSSVEPRMLPSAVVTLSEESVLRSKEETSGVRYGYNSQGLYFGTPDEFFASVKANYQQLGYEVTDEYMANFKNEFQNIGPNGGSIAPPLRRYGHEWGVV